MVLNACQHSVLKTLANITMQEYSCGNDILRCTDCPFHQIFFCFRREVTLISEQVTLLFSFRLFIFYFFLFFAAFYRIARICIFMIIPYIQIIPTEKVSTCGNIKDVFLQQQFLHREHLVLNNCQH